MRSVAQHGTRDRRGPDLAGRRDRASGLRAGAAVAAERGPARSVRMVTPSSDAAVEDGDGVTIRCSEPESRR